MNRGTFISDDTDGINGLTQSKCFERSVQEKQMHKRASFLNRNSMWVMGGLLLTSTGVNAANITVDTFVDEISPNGECSLREAIINANNDNQSGSTDCAAGVTAEVDTIQLQAGTYTLSISGRSEDVAVTGDLDLTQVNTAGDGYLIRGQQPPVHR